MRKEEGCLQERKQQIYEQILAVLDLSRDMQDEELQYCIEKQILEAGKQQYLSIDEKCRLQKELFHKIRGLDIIEELLEENEITEIMINGYQQIFFEKKGKLYLWEKSFESEEKLRVLIQQMAAGANRMVNEANPITDTRLLDGSRVNIVLPPIALDGPIVTIRKFSKDNLTLLHMIESGMLTKEAAQFLICLVKAGYNLFISGGTGSGKTTFLNALSAYIPSEERIITIEDAAELRIQNVPNLVRLEVRNANIEGCSAVTIRDLIKTALRMRPDRIIVGEVRGAEAIDMIQAMNTGHDGSLSTGHANSPGDMLSRLETMILLEKEIPLLAIRKQIASAVDIIVQLGRLRDGTRHVLEIAEVLGCVEGEIELNRLFFFEEKGVEDEDKVVGTLKKVGELICFQKLKKAGLVRREDYGNMIIIGMENENGL